MNKNVLGRGLSTLLPSRSQPISDAPATTPAPAPATSANPTELGVAEIVPNPFQPRKHFDEAALHELAQSIRIDGIVQPLVVRKAGNLYQLIAGERRWRAATMAGLERVPVYVQEMADDRMLEVALVENIQREDLNPIEASQAFQRLSEELGLSHEEIGRRTGKDRATISNLIRLLQLPAEIQRLVAERKLSAGHARTLLKLTDVEKMKELAHEIVSRDLSVRFVEQLTADVARKQPVESRKENVARMPDPNVRAAIEELERVLGTRVRIVEKAAGKGRVEIDFFSPDDLDRIYTAITGTPA